MNSLAFVNMYVSEVNQEIEEMCWEDHEVCALHLDILLVWGVEEAQDVAGDAEVAGLA